MNRESRHRERDVPVYTDDYDRSAKRHKSDRTSVGSDQRSSSEQQYRTLCVSHLNCRLTDSQVSEMIYRDLRKFGDFNVKVVHNGNHRIAYVNFRYPEDAKLAKHACYDRVVLLDVGKRIDAVYNTKPQNVSPGGPREDYYRSGSPQLMYSERKEEYIGRRDVNNYYVHDLPPLMAKGPAKNEKFMHHGLVEDDEIATRTLFVGNLAYDITVDELKQVFEPYGFVEDVDIKRNAQGHGNIYAFVRFAMLDMARRAKMEMSGQYIRKYQCRIGYGKPTPSVCVFVGGLGPWISKDELLREFDRFGEVRLLDWPHSKDFAYVLYDTVECAMEAVKHMRGRDFGGIDRRLRVDFADETCILAPDSLPKSGPGRNGRTGLGRDYDPVVDLGKDRDNYNRNSVGRGGDWRMNRGVPKIPAHDLAFEADRKVGGGYERSSAGPLASKHRPSEANTCTAERIYRTHSRTADDRDDARVHPESHKRRRSSSDRRYSDRDTPDGGGAARRTKDGGAAAMSSKTPEEATSITNLARCLPVVWSGALMLKNSKFLTKMHLLSGDSRLVTILMGDVSSSAKPVLKITQRLRLDQQKLGEVRRRINLSGQNGCSILLAMPVESGEDDGATDSAGGQQRPLKNLVAYLKQKEAAGVISLPPSAGQSRETGLLHAFPSCPFAQQYMTKYAPRLADDYAKEDHLLILLVRVHA